MLLGAIAVMLTMVVTLPVGVPAITKPRSAHARLFSPAVHADARERRAGPLDIAQVSFGQQGTDLTLAITTTGTWKTASLDHRAGRRLCVDLFHGGRRTPRSRVCAQERDGSPQLRFSRLDAGGRSELVRKLNASVTRPDGRSIQATFSASAAEIPRGRFRWRVESRWRDEGLCPPEAACADSLPDSGLVTTRSSLLAFPACFGAAARDPRRPCASRALARVAFPAPADAVLQPNAFCLQLGDRSILNVCRFRAAPRAEESEPVALIGDSHAAHWRAALNVVATAKRWRGFSLTRTGCPFSAATPVLPQVPRRQCALFKRRVVAWLRAHRDVSTVFIANHTGAIVVPRGRDKYESKVEGYRRALRWLPSSVRRVIVIRGTPRNAPGSMSCVERAVRRGRRTGRACALRRSWAVPRDPAADAVRRMQSRRVRLLDMTRFFCGRRYCYPVVGGALVHKDEGHLTDTFSTTLGPYLLRRVTALTSAWR